MRRVKSASPTDRAMRSAPRQLVGDGSRTPSSCDPTPTRTTAGAVAREGVEREAQGWGPQRARTGPWGRGSGAHSRTPSHRRPLARRRTWSWRGRPPGRRPTQGRKATPRATMRATGQRLSARIATQTTAPTTRLKRHQARGTQPGHPGARDLLAQPFTGPSPADAGAGQNHGRPPGRGQCRTRVRTRSLSRSPPSPAGRLWSKPAAVKRSCMSRPPAAPQSEGSKVNSVEALYLSPSTRPGTARTSETQLRQLHVAHEVDRGGVRPVVTFSPARRGRMESRGLRAKFA